MEEKYNQLDEDNVLDTSEKSKPSLVTPEKKPSVDVKKESESTVSASASKTEIKEEEDQDSDHEDPHGMLTTVNVLPIIY